jgi:hypothetical protein
VLTNALLLLGLLAKGRISIGKRPLQLRSLPETLSNFAARVTAEICVMQRNACKPLSTFCIWGAAKPSQISGSRHPADFS